MNFKTFSDEALDEQLFKSFKQEREILTSILHQLKEANDRRIYSKFGYRSLFYYAVERFGLSESEAYRRIAAMNLLYAVPQIEAKIEQGSLSLSNLAAAQTFFRQEKLSDRERTVEQKAELLQKLENCSKAAAEKVIKAESGSAAGEEFIQYKFRADISLQKKLKRLFDLKLLPQSALSELLDSVCDIALDKLDPLKKAERISKKMSVSQKSPVTFPEQKSCVKNSTQERSRYIPAATRHAVFMRDKGKCTICGSTRAIEIEHIKPFAKGGDSSLQNLNLLCRSCNQRSAIDAYGREKMSQFFSRR
jgi:hypothetical protein